MKGETVHVPSIIFSIYVKFSGVQNLLRLPGYKCLQYHGSFVILKPTYKPYFIPSLVGHPLLGVNYSDITRDFAQ